MDATYFQHPKAEWQRRYEALRASFVDRLSAEAIAARFGYTRGYVYLLRHRFNTGKLDFAGPVAEGKKARHRVPGEVREKICTARRSSLSAGEISRRAGATIVSG